MLNAALLPLFYLPPVLWFSEFLKADEISLEKFENFPKQTYRNRTRIYGANGALNLIIPIEHGNGRLYQQTRTSERENWRALHWKSIKTAYQSSAYFEYYEDRLQAIYDDKETNLFTFNLNVLQIFLGILKIEKSFTFTNEYEPTPAFQDLRNSFNAKSPDAQNLPAYYQVFSDKYGFLSNLSILDLICNLGPESLPYLLDLSKH